MGLDGTVGRARKAAKAKPPLAASRFDSGPTLKSMGKPESHCSPERKGRLDFGVGQGYNECKPSTRGPCGLKAGTARPLRQCRCAWKQPVFSAQLTVRDGHGALHQRRRRHAAKCAGEYPGWEPGVWIAPLSVLCDIVWFDMEKDVERDSRPCGELPASRGMVKARRQYPLAENPS